MQRRAANSTGWAFVGFAAEPVGDTVGAAVKSMNYTTLVGGGVRDPIDG